MRKNRGLAHAAAVAAIVGLAGIGTVVAQVERVELRVDGLTCPL